MDLHGIRPGERWRQKLQQANGRCEAVICCFRRTGKPHASADYKYLETRTLPHNDQPRAPDCLQRVIVRGHAHLSTRLRASERNPQDLSHADQVRVVDDVSVGGEQPRPQVAVAVNVLRDTEQRVARDDLVRLKPGVRRAE